MSSYPVNTNLTYTAVPATEGFVAGDHTVSWAFSDSTTASGASVSKSWSTEGFHTATATATNTITGGTAVANKLVEIDSYDWSIQGSMPTHYIRAPLSGQISANLVLSIGGITTGSVKHALCYEYDGTTWTQVGDMARPRTSFNNDRGFRVPTLNNGKILVAGNTVNLVGGGVTCELYDPTAKTWSSTGSMNADRSYRCFPVKLDDGRVFVYGGSSIAAAGQNTYEIYNQNTGVWTSMGTIGTTSDAIGAIPYKMSDGRVFVVSTATAVARIYNPTSNTWFTCATNGAFGAYRNNMSAIEGQDGNIYLLGHNGANSFASCRYIVATNTWEALPNAGGALTGDPELVGTQYIHLVATSLGTTSGSRLFNINSQTWELERPFVTQGVGSLETSGAELGRGTLGGKLILWGSPSDTSAPYTPPEIFNGI